MKGSTKIILTDVKTGKQEIHEDTNLITNALDKIININVGINRPLNEYVLPIMENALGGIMLFDGQLTEDVDNIHFPVEAHLVGYASTDVNSDDKFRGSYNKIESVRTDHGFVSVWDFGTAQANGTIRAIARTSAYAGQCPVYNYFPPSRWDTREESPSTDQNWFPIRYDGEYVYLMKSDSTNHTMRLAKVKKAMLRMGCADWSEMSAGFEVITSWNTEVTSYTYYDRQSDYDAKTNPRTRYVYADSAWHYEDGHDGYIYCMFYGPSERWFDYDYDITYFTIRYDDGSFTKSETHRLSSNTSYYSGYTTNSMYNAQRWSGHVNHGLLYRMDNSRKVINIIPLDNPATYRSVRLISDSSRDYIEDMHIIAPQMGGIYFEQYHYTDTSATRWDGILYPDGVYMVPEIGRPDNHWSDYSYRDCGVICEDLTAWFKYTSDSYIQRSWVANYLGTINNLSSPITKTAAQTMKIVYTLTDIDEEG